MTENIRIEQKIQQYKKANPHLQKLSDKQILSIMVENKEIVLTDAQKILFLQKQQTTKIIKD